MTTEFIVLDILIALVGILNALDYAATHLILDKGRGTEVGPIMKYAVQYLGSNWWVVKLPILGLLWALWLIRNENVEVSLVSAAALSLFYTYTVIGNYQIAWRQD